MNDIIIYENKTDRALEYLENNVSALTIKNYAPAIQRFLLWAEKRANPNPAETMAAYKAALLKEGLNRRTVNKHLSAVRAYFKSQAVLGVISHEILQSINVVANLKVEGQRHGLRLTIEQAHLLLSAPDKETLIGLRDRAILAIMLGCGLRRSEVVNLTWGHIQQENGIWLIRNLQGKHGRIRTIVIPTWVKRTIAEYSNIEKDKDRIFKSFDVHGNLRKSMTDQTVYNIVVRYGAQIGVELAPHDLRRTYASIARQTGGVEGMTQLQRQLGHASLRTTELYIGEEDDFAAVSNFIPDLSIG
jgi:integrase